MSAFAGQRAVVVGIDRYGCGIAPLHTAAADARAVAACLERDHGYRDPLLLLDGAASLARLTALLEEELPAQTAADDRLVLYFAGHGVARGDGTEGPQGYLLPCDARPAAVESWLSMAWVRRALDRLACRHLLVVLDCCFAGSFRWTATRSFVPIGEPLYDSQYERFLAGTAWQVLTSASHDERALDVTPGLHNLRDSTASQNADSPAGIASPSAPPSSGHSPFAGALLRGLAGDADSTRRHHAPDGVITATELHQYICAELAGTATHFAPPQTPGIWPLKPENTGEYVFLSPAQEKRTRPDPPLDDTNDPWRGLAPYTAADAALFFGRRRVVDELCDQLAAAPDRLLEVVGASGVGKSSAVRAGLVPQLRADGWRVAVADRLGEDPAVPVRAAVAELAVGAAAGDRRLLVIDQFEELYTHCLDPERRAELVTLLHALLAGGPGGCRVLITLRSDFEPQLAAAELPVVRCVVAPPSPAELREIVVKPAQHKALYFEPATLVGELIDEVTAMPGGLPLLSFALSETYRQAVLRRRRTGASDRALTAADYDAVGGVVGGLHSRARALVEAADPAMRDTIRRVFLRMVSTQGGQVGRRRVSRRELDVSDPDEQARVARVLRDFMAARLLVSDQGRFEPAHDTLVLAWRELAQWRAECAETLPLLRSAWHAAAEWQLHGRDRRLLWHADPRLPQLESLAGELNRLERDFADASRQRQRSNQRLLAGAATGVLAVVSGFAVYSFKKARLAESRRRDAVEVADRIVFAIDGELQPIAGTAEVRRQLLDASSELLDRLRVGARQDRGTLRSRVASHLRRGDLALSHDDLTLVEKEYRAAAALARRLVAARPSDAGARHDLAVSYAKLGSVAKALGALGQAQRWYEKGVEICRRLARRMPGNAAWQRDLAIGCNRLGSVAEEREDFAQARVWYEESLTIKLRLVRRDPRDSQAQRDLFISCDKLGDLARRCGDLASAQDWYEKAVRIKKELARREPRSTNWQRGLAFGWDRLGKVAEARGELAQARVFYQQSLAIKRDLVAGDPGNTLWQRDLADSCEQLGSVAAALGEPPAARDWYEQGLAIHRELARRDPRNAIWRDNVERSRSLLAQVAADLTGFAGRD